MGCAGPIPWGGRAVRAPCCHLHLQHQLPGTFPMPRYDPAHCHTTAEPCLSLLQSASTTSPIFSPSAG